MLETPAITSACVSNCSTCRLLSPAANPFRTAIWVVSLERIILLSFLFSLKIRLGNSCDTPVKPWTPHRENMQAGPMRLVEYHRLIAVTENPMLQMPLNGPRQHDPLQVPALLDQILHLIPVRNARHILLDDRPIVQCLRNVVAGGTNQFDSPVKCRVIRPGAHKGRQERMVDIDNPGRIPRDELG